MAHVKIGSARIDERGKTTGGVAGDQTGNEVSTQNWYNHSKGWRVFRPLNSSIAQAIARCMESACANNKIGYDQSQRNTLYNAAKPLGFDTAKVTTAVETDCSALVRVCLAYAGVMVSDFNTSSEASTIMKTGLFVELTGSQYTAKEDYLRRGDILVTKTKGHTVVVLSNGDKAGAAPDVVKTYNLGDRILRNGMEGPDVKELQGLLISAGYSCGSWGADGEFGDATEMAVRNFQTRNHCEVDGEVGPETLAALEKVLGEGDGDPENPKQVKISGGNCYVRETPDKINGKQMGVAFAGTFWPYTGERSEDGWLRIIYTDGRAGWVSGMYGQLVA